MLATDNSYVIFVDHYWVVTDFSSSMLVCFELKVKAYG